jgi:hypothetical protein
MRLNLEVNAEQMGSVKTLIRRTGARDMKDLINNAISILEWAVEETGQGNEIVAINRDTSNYRVLVTPLLQHVARHRPAPSPTPAETAKATEGVLV